MPALKDKAAKAAEKTTKKAGAGVRKAAEKKKEEAAAAAETIRDQVAAEKIEAKKSVRSAGRKVKEAVKKAAEPAAEKMEEDARRISALRDFVEAELLRLQGTVRNGEGERLPGIANLSFRGAGGEAASLLCGLAGVMLSAGSACHAGNEEPSRVLLSMTGDRVRASSALRISLGRETTEEDARAVIRAVKDAVERIRNG